MRIGVVDVGGNTARLLVAEAGIGGIERIAQERAVLGLGAEIEKRGTISRRKLRETRDVVAKLVERAENAACEEVGVYVTSPGRQSANRDALAQALGRAALGRVRFVSAPEEARLAFVGAVAERRLRGSVAVCDVGGGSTELAVGVDGEPFWLRSVDLGSLRVTRRHLDAAPRTDEALAGVRAAVEDELRDLAPPRAAGPATALATGGTARALSKLVGERLGRDELAHALELTLRTKPRKLAARYGLPGWRAPLLAGGALLLAEVQRLLGVPLAVSASGFREGAALELLAEQAQAA